MSPRRRFGLDFPLCDLRVEHVVLFRDDASCDLRPGLLVENARATVGLNGGLSAVVDILIGVGGEEKDVGAVYRNQLRFGVEDLPVGAVLLSACLLGVVHCRVLEQAVAVVTLRAVSTHLKFARALHHRSLLIVGYV